MKRMILKKLTLSGDGKGDAILEFQKGLNIITGDSDTGKTYAFQCLNYILGAEKLPKEIKEAKGYKKLSLLFSVDEKEYLIERNLGDAKIIAKYDGKQESLSYKHDPVSNKNLSKFILSILFEKDDNIQLKKNAKNGKRTLSFRDLVHLCLIDETDIIAERSAFQTEQYTERTVRSSIFKYIISGKDDSDIIQAEDSSEEKLRRAGVVRFLVQKKESLIKKIEEIEKNPNFKLYSTSQSLTDIASRINELRTDISKLNASCIEKEKTLEFLKKECFSDEVKILDFQKTRDHYVEVLNQNGVIQTYADFLLQTPQLDCPICGRKFSGNSAFTNETSNDLFEFFRDQSIELSKKISGVKETIVDVTTRLENNKAQIKVIQEELGVSKQAIEEFQQELKELNKNIIIIRQLDSMNKALEIYHQELVTIEGEIVAYSEKEKSKQVQTKETKTTIFDSYCDFVYKVLKQWGFDGEFEIEFNPKTLDIIVGDKERTNWGKGYRAFVMSAMSVALMRYCYNNSKLHPGFVILDSPLVSLKERKKDETGEWINDYMERKMIEDILVEDCFHQVIIFENKDLKYGYDFNYIEFNHDGDGRTGFIPK